jgi:hypothetical protein
MAQIYAVVRPLPKVYMVVSERFTLIGVDGRITDFIQTEFIFNLGDGSFFDLGDGSLFRLG